MLATDCFKNTDDKTQAPQLNIHSPIVSPADPFSPSHATFLLSTSALAWVLYSNYPLFLKPLHTLSMCLPIPQHPTHMVLWFEH